MKHSFLFAAVAAAVAFGSVAQGTEVKVKVLAAAEGPTQKTVLIGPTLANNMIFMFEIEPAKTMWMRMGSPAKWTEHPPGPNERFHVEVKPIDPGSINVRLHTSLEPALQLFSSTRRDDK